jgi:dTDP-4-dehydrorhamnose 3,5-epimerase
MTEDKPEFGELFRFQDERGSWSRIFDQKSFPNLKVPIAQSSISITNSQGTLRGLHSLNQTAGEWKLVTVCQGTIWDVAVDIRKESPTFGDSYSAELSGEKGNFVLIPPGWAHGFITLTDNVVMAYSMTAEYNQALEIGARWDSASLNIQWPMQPKIVSEKDSRLPAI